jgi:hypothetical protein
MMVVSRVVKLVVRMVDLLVAGSVSALVEMMEK